MQEYNVIVTETAEVEINDYLDFIAQDSVVNAINWYNKIHEKIVTLSSFALRSPIADESLYFEFEVRCLLIDNYRVLYRVNNNTVEILHVKHPNMDR